MTVALDVRRLGVTFGTRAGLREISFAVAAGECLAILGVSGSGKSSLLRTIAGLQPSSEGEVLVHGRSVTMLPPEARRVVYLHQEPVLFPNRTVLRNVAFPLEVRGVSQRDASARALVWLKRLRVSELADRAPTALSGGQRHRVALARALCAEPDVLLLDEPLASLDPAVRRDVRAALQDARAASGAAMVLVTHDLDDALSIASRIMIIENQTQVAVASADEMLAAPPSLAVAQLLGVFGEIPGHIVTGGTAPGFRWIGGAVAVQTALTGRVIACVRPHDVRVQRARHSDADALVLVARRDGATSTRLTLRDQYDETVDVPAPLDVDARDGDIVQVVLRAAIVFPAP
jgi:putative spermidine/putrescine transport system ATP-binding protein